MHSQVTAHHCNAEESHGVRVAHSRTPKVLRTQFAKIGTFANCTQNLFFPHRLSITACRKYGWGAYDIGMASRNIPAEGYVDNVHFRSVRFQWEISHLNDSDAN